jgi:hypothetical protein
LKTVEETDTKVDAAAQMDSQDTNDLFGDSADVGQIEIDFEKANPLESGIEIESSFLVGQGAAEALSAEEQLQGRLVKEAIATFDLAFFQQFSFGGKDSMKLAQRGLEEYIIQLNDNVEVQKLLLSMVHQKYELNTIIPNIELLLAKMFFSPLSTKELREGADS